MPVKCSTDKEFLYLRAIVCLLMCLNDSLFMAMFFGASIIKKLLLKFILIDGTILSSYILFSYCSIKANGAYRFIHYRYYYYNHPLLFFA